MRRYQQTAGESRRCVVRTFAGAGLFDETSKPDDTQSTSQETARLVNSLSSTRLLDDNGIVTKANCEIASQLIKAEMDKLNNDSQTNPGRLQPLVNVQRFI